MDTNEILAVLTAGKDVQEFRGYWWQNGNVSRDGPICPGGAIAQVLDAKGARAVADHPASLVLAQQFEYNTDPEESLSYRVGHEGRTRGGFTLEDILARWEAAIAKVRAQLPVLVGAEN